MQPMFAVQGPRSQHRNKSKACCWLAGICDWISQEILEEVSSGGGRGAGAGDV